MVFLRRLTVDERRSLSHWAMEFVVVVVGVLIALWLQDWSSRRQSVETMNAAEAAIHAELRQTLISLMWRQAIRDCHRHRVQVLSDMLNKTGDEWPGLNENAILDSMGSLPRSVAPGIYQRPVDSFTEAAWNSALTTGALAPMDRDRFSSLVNIYDKVELMRETSKIEDDAASRLSPLVNRLHMTPELRVEMLRGVYDLDRTRFIFEFQGNPPDWADSMRQLGWNDGAAIDKSIADDRRDAAQRGITFRPCVAHQVNPFRNKM